MLTAGYNFPAGTFQVQKWTAALFIENPRGYCINELGTGKTRSILFAFDALKQAGLVQRMIVLCPLTAMRQDMVGIEKSYCAFRGSRRLSCMARKQHGRANSCRK